MKRKLICWLPLLLLIGCSQPTYRTTSLTPDKRAELLLKELTLEEKVALMMDTSQPVERLGIKPYNWWNEALYGAQNEMYIEGWTEKGLNLLIYKRLCNI